MNQELNINISIADRQYPLKIKAEDQQIVQKAAEEINAMIKEYSKRYAFKDKQDLLAMAILQFSTRLQKLESTKEKDDRILDDLKYIDSLLSVK